MARAVEKVTAARRVKIEEDTRDHNDLLSKTGLKKVETVGDGLRKTLEVEPAREC
jgi:hypothetical protein